MAQYNIVRTVHSAFNLQIGFEAKSVVIRRYSGGATAVVVTGRKTPTPDVIMRAVKTRLLDRFSAMEMGSEQRIRAVGLQCTRGNDWQIWRG